MIDPPTLRNRVMDMGTSLVIFLYNIRSFERQSQI